MQAIGEHGTPLVSSHAEAAGDDNDDDNDGIPDDMDDSPNDHDNDGIDDHEDNDDVNDVRCQMMFLKCCSHHTAQFSSLTLKQFLT